MTPCVPPAIVEKPPMKTAASAGPQRVAVRRRRCIECESPFFYRVGKGADRWTCSGECQARRHLKRAAVNTAALKSVTCSNPKCGNKRARKGSGLCEGCYMRLRRNGTLEYRLHNQRYINDAGYVFLRIGNHPMSVATTGGVAEHRKVLYDHLGPGAHPCFWCGRSLEWKALVVDHLNENKADNRTENLVPSCNQCNRARGQFLGFLRKMQPERFNVLAEAFRGVVMSAHDETMP